MSTNNDALLWRVNHRQRVRGGGRDLIRGLDAATDIPKGTKITTFHSSGIFPSAAAAQFDDAKHHHFTIGINQDAFMRLTNINCGKNLKDSYDNMVGNLCNHAASSSPQCNAEMRINRINHTITLWSTRLIKQGEAIMYDYCDKDWTSKFWDKKKKNRKLFPNLKQGIKPPLKKKRKK
jgi:hypothetical protein